MAAAAQKAVAQGVLAPGVRALAQGFYGVPETELVKAEGLDIAGADAAAILNEAKARIDEYFASVNSRQ